MYQDKFIKTNKISIHYLDNNANSENLVVIFPPGIQDARFINELNLNNKERIICLSYPSRYKSSILNENNSIEVIAKYCTDFLRIYLKENRISHIKLVGFSFGSAVAMKLIENNFIHVDKIVLVNTGEFFNKNTKQILRYIFIPALNNYYYAKVLKLILCKFLKVFKEEYFPDDRLLEINEQWISTLDYKIDIAKTVQIPTTIFIGTNDTVIDSKSKEKINKKFTKLQTILYYGKHILNYEFSKDYSKIYNQLEAELEF